NRIKASDSGCSFWWLEYGGRMDTVHESQDIKKELWKVTYGIWDYIKNSGKFPEAENLTLEWVGMIPGKRESRRFDGDYMLRQSDIIEQKTFDDAVSFGGWAVDLHPADGVYTDISPCNQYHSKGVYQIPWRCMYSRNVDNLFLAGRLISVSHVAFGSTRVMMTSAHGAQSVALGAKICLQKGISPRELGQTENIEGFQRELIRTGQFIPFLDQKDKEDLIHKAVLKASSVLALSELPGSGTFEFVDDPKGILLPLPSGNLPIMEFTIKSKQLQILRVQLRKAVKVGNFSPEIILEEQKISISAGQSDLRVKLTYQEDKNFYGLLTFIPEHPYEMETSSITLPGLLSLYHELNDKVAKSVIQEAPEGSGIHSFEFWLPHRRPMGMLPAVKFSRALRAFSPAGVTGGYERPSHQDFGWVPDLEDKTPSLTARWKNPVKASEVILCFDTDFDNAMETVQVGHAVRHMPNCVRHFCLRDQNGRILMEDRNNYQSRKVLKLAAGTEFSELKLEILSTWGAPPAVFRIRVLP
uniref:FAD-dependent oxidoreductase n=1 Tax=Oceanispirochaeta sp. TaxID=2035350 RepID=UPI002616CBD8